MDKAMFVLASLAVFATCAVAAPAATGCTNVTQVQTGKLVSQTPNNCLSSPEAAEQLIVPATCFDEVKMHIANQTGAACKPGPLAFNVTFANVSDECMAGIEVGTGEMTVARTGANTLKGALATGQEFTGTSSADGTFTVSVDGVDCKLSFLTTSVTGNATKLPATNATNDMDEAPEDNSTAPAVTTPPAATTARSSAFTAAPAVLLALVGSALALAF